MACLKISARQTPEPFRRSSRLTNESSNWRAARAARLRSAGWAPKTKPPKKVRAPATPLVIASGKKQNVLPNILAGEEEGTLFVPQPTRLKGRKRWIAFFHHPKGALFVDAGAKKALREKGKSLLPPGVARCEGGFSAGEVVRICDLDGTEFARGISDFSSDEIKALQLARVEVVHRDNLVIL